MLTLLNLLSGIALLVWGTYIVRTSVLHVYGADLRRLLSHSLNHRGLAFLAGLGVTSLVQSSNATALITASFVSQNLMSLATGLSVLLGADVGTALMTRILGFNLSGLAPTLIFFGVTIFLLRKTGRVAQIARAAIGLGLILMALQIISEAARAMTQAAGVQFIFSSLTGDDLLDALVGAAMAMAAYSSLAAVLLTATLAASQLISIKVAFCLVIGANIGSGILAVLTSARQEHAGRSHFLFWC